MNTKHYLATVGLERNRWGSRDPSIRVSEWIDRVLKDGFDGLELWSYHYLRADEAEQERLIARQDAIAVYNSYVGFDDDSAEQRTIEADAIAKLGTTDVKYNLGHHTEQLAAYKRNLLAWAETLPAATRLICECHQGSAVDTVESSQAFFGDLDPEKFVILVHPLGDPQAAKPWFDAFGSRIVELHIQLRPPEADPDVPACREGLDRSVELVKSYHLPLNIVLEFTRGIKRDEDTEEIYANFLKDLAYFKAQFGSA